MVPPTTEWTRISAEGGRQLLGIARSAIVEAVAGRELENLDAGLAGSHLTEARPCFVTLLRSGQLRGCIGQLTAREPLWLAVARNAARAALRDPRFPALAPAEVELVRIEVSVLGPTRVLGFSNPAELVKQLRPGVDGVVLEAGGYMATFLPQVWESLSDACDFMEHLSRKACGRADLWRMPGASVSVYEVEVFAEPE
jgi:AmmeMemoRadiSam system protein A